MEEDLELMCKVLPDPESQGYANNVNTGPCLKNAKQLGADVSVQFSAKAGKMPPSTDFNCENAFGAAFRIPFTPPCLDD